MGVGYWVLGEELKGLGRDNGLDLWVLGLLGWVMGLNKKKLEKI